MLSAFIQSYERVRKGQTRGLASLFSSEETRDAFLNLLARAEVVYTESTENLQEFLNDDDPFLQQHAIEKLLTVDPSFARDWISGQSPSLEMDEVIVQAAESFLDDDFAKGAQWFLRQELSAPNARSDRLVTLVSALSYQEDGESAAEWLLQQPDTAERDQAELYVAHQRLNSRDFEGSVAWISGITDPALREQVISEVLPEENLGSGIGESNLLSTSTRVNSNRIDAIRNNPMRNNSDFIGTVDRVYIPGIPRLYSDIDRAKFREAAERAGLIQPVEAE